MSFGSKRLPESVSTWRELAIEWNATGGMDELGSPVKVASASKFGFENFIGLQVIYAIPKDQSRLPDAIIKQFPPSSGITVESLPGYKAYLDEVEKAGKQGFSQDFIAKTCVPRTLGPFVNVWQFQRHILVGDENAADIAKISKVTPVSPVAKRTRAMIRARQQEQAATPTPAPKVKSASLTRQTANLTLGGSDLKNFMGPETTTSTRSLVGQRAFSSGVDDSDDSDDDDDDEEIPGMHFPTPPSRYLCVIRHILVAVTPSV